MEAKLVVTRGSVRIFKELSRPGDPVSAPYEHDLTGDWGVGSGTKRDKGPEPSEVELTFKENGNIRLYTEGNESENVEVKEGETRKFKMIESNAITVSTGF